MMPAVITSFLTWKLKSDVFHDVGTVPLVALKITSWSTRGDRP